MRRSVRAGRARDAALAAAALLGIACAGGPGAADAGRDAGIDAGPRCLPASGLPSPLACNGRAELCDRAYDAVSFPMTHNAMSSEEDRWRPPNQGPSLWHQLEDGVRGFMLDTWPGEDGVLLCHGACGRVLGERPLADALRDLREFADCHPAEVLTVIFEAHVDEPAMAGALEAAGLLPYLHEQPDGAPWPTLRAMIESGRRIVIFTESAAATLPYYHYAYRHMWDTDYANRTPADLDCAVLRGDRSNDLFLVNHFLTAPVAMRSLADMVNYDPVLGDHLERCRSETGQLPNFVAVDFYDASDLFAAVGRLNGL